MATVTVSSDAGDSPDYTTIGAALAAEASPVTIQVYYGSNAGVYAESLSLATANMDGKTVIIEPVDVEAGTIRISGGATGWPILGNDQVVTGTLTINDISFDTVDTTRGRCVYLLASVNAFNVDFNFNRCSLDASTLTIDGSADNNPGTITLTDCTVLSRDNNCVQMDNGSFVASGTSFNAGIQCLLFDNSNFTGSVDVQDCTFTTDADDNSNYALEFRADSLPTSIRFIGNTVINCVGGLIAQDVTSFDYIDVRDNVLTMSGTGLPKGGILLGLDSGWVSGSPDNCVVTGNKVDMGTVEAHGLLIGQGIIGAEISNNEIIGGNFCFVVKGDTNNIHGNIAKGPKTLFVSGGKQNVFTSNTIISTSAFAVDIDINTADARLPAGNILTSNIFDASLGGTYAFLIGTENKHYDTVLDYNCLNAGSSGLAFIDNEALNTISSIQAKWQSSDFDTPNFWVSNDQNSINEDPRFDANYKPTNPEVITGGTPDVNDNPTSIGAIGATAGGKGRYNGGGRYS